ncbi:MAG: riboflavin synthase [Actinomycetota bacterium]
MYTGIVTTGTVVDLVGSRLVVRSPLLVDCEIGASVSINGVCLTVVARDGEVCSFDISDETFSRSAIGEVATGERVNVERPLRAGAELGGHIVQGHVDAVGEIVSVTAEGDGSRVRVAFPPGLGRYIVEKGSVTVDGVSLTVTELDDSSFALALIPETLRVTTFGEAIPGRKVNLEVDVLAKYVEKLLAPVYGAR